MKYQEALAFIHQGYAAHRRCWDLDEAYRRTRQGLHVFLRNPSKDELFVGRRGRHRGYGQRWPATGKRRTGA